MIRIQSRVNVVDNTGAKELLCIGIVGKGKKFAKIGDIIIGVVKKSLPNVSIKKANIVKALIIRTKQSTLRNDGSYIRFDDNAVVLINNDRLPIGTRIFGPVTRELRFKNFTKVISLAQETI